MPSISSQSRADTACMIKKGGGFSFYPDLDQAALSLGNFYLDIQLKHFPKFL